MYVDMYMSKDKYLSLLFNKLQHNPNMVMMLSISVIRR